MRNASVGAVNLTWHGKLQPFFHRVVLINYSLVLCARLSRCCRALRSILTRADRRCKPSETRQQPLSSRRRRKCARARHEGLVGVNMSVKRPGIYRGSSLGRVLSYRHHLFSMPISVAYAPIGLTARNPQRRRKVEEGKKKKNKGKRARSSRRPFRERTATSALQNNPSLCSSAITTNYGGERWLRTHMRANLS